jgi:hypothetical protein
MPRRIVVRAATTAVFVCAALAAACTPDPDLERLRQTTRPEYDQQSGRLRRLTYDANKNGRVDSWVYMDGPRMLRAEIDADEDGRIERWEYYSEDGTLQKVGVSSAGDARVDRWITPGPAGEPAGVEEDTNGDGRPDKWETYLAGRLASVAFDANGDGRPDRRLNYGAGGQLVSIESDPDDKGTFRKKILLR